MCNHKALDDEWMKYKKYGCDNFVNETHRNIDESNQGKKKFATVIEIKKKCKKTRRKGLN